MSLRSCKLTLDWDYLSRLSSRPKLRDIAKQAELVAVDVYRVGDCEYIQACEQWDDEFTEETIYVNAVVWAPSFGSLLRMLTRKRSELTLDDGLSDDMPLQLQLGNGFVSFEGIRNYCMTHDAEVKQHFDLYDESSQSIGSYMTFGAWSYFFRSPRPVPNTERPFAVRFLTNRRMLMPTG